MERTMEIGKSKKLCQPNWMLLTVLMLLALSLPVKSTADDYDPAKFNPAQFVEYERQLNAILKTRRDEEKQFIATRDFVDFLVETKQQLNEIR